jgi:hypothetical protein
MTYKQASDAFTNGQINGFSVGERVFAKRNTVLTAEDKSSLREVNRGLHLLATRFSRGRYWFKIGNTYFSGRKSHFETFPNGKVVLETY